MPESGTMRTVALAPEAQGQVLEADLARAASVRLCESRSATLELILSHQMDAAVFGLPDRGDGDVAGLVAEARKRDSRVRLIVEVPATRSAFQQIPAVLRAGGSEIAVQGYERLGEVVMTVLAPDWQPGAGRALLDIVPRMVPGNLEAFAVACALKGSPRLTTELVAEWVETSPRTIRSRLRRASLAPPLTFVRYCSAAHAMCLLFPQGLAPKHVVERMRFGSRRALYDLVQGYSESETDPVPKRWAYAALLLRAGEFLRRPAVRPPASIGLDLERLERYVNNELSVSERVEFERGVIVPALTEAGETLERIRQWSSVRHLEPDLRQRRDETWVRLLRSIGKGPRR